MIAKGAARNNPRQLAVYLMRVERYETGEPVELLELQSGWAAKLKPGSDRSHTAAWVIEAFRDWQVLAEGTKQGRDGLYHAEVSPAPLYAGKMTPEQWVRAAVILGEELGFQDQPRAIFLHDGTDGRKHMHVVWARTDVETMKIISDGYNFVAHEKASHRMELEFGHEFVPGKHDKRDREKQPEMPRQEYDYAEAQIAERTGMTVAERKAEIAALKLTAANGREFKLALEDAGYVLAKGERGYIVVDEAGVFSALSKNLGMKKAQIETFLADVPLDQLPTIKEAKTLQKQKALTKQQGEIADALPAKTAEISATERKQQVTALRQRTDSAPAFKSALEEAGYILARGEARDFLLVDEQGKAFGLSRQVTDIKGKQFKAFMAPLDPAALPDVEQAKAIQQQRVAEARKQGLEASKFLTPETARKLEERAPSPPAPEPKTVPQKPAAPTYDPTLYAPEPQLQKPPPASRFLPPPEVPDVAAQQVPAEPAPPPEFSRFARKPDAPASKPVAPAPRAPQAEDPEITAIKKAVAERHAQDDRKSAEADAAELRQKALELSNKNAWKLEDFDVGQNAKMGALIARLDRQNRPRKGLRGALDAIKKRLDPAQAIEQAHERRREIDQLQARQRQERDDYIKRLEETKQGDLQGLKQRQAQHQRDRDSKHAEEVDRYIREHFEAKRILAEIEEQRKKDELERKDEFGEGPEPPGEGK